ncbi:hypothetical protein [Nocardia sp. NBC_00511]
MEVPDTKRWNHNVEYHSFLTEAVAEAHDELEVECGVWTKPNPPATHP